MKDKCMLKTMILILLTSLALNAQDDPFIWVFLNTNPNRPDLPKAQVDSLQAGHMANISRLAKDGHLLIAGPFYGGGGIFGFRRMPMDSVKELVGSDPAVKAGRFILEYLPYTPIVGSICSPGENFTMTTYFSIRIGSENAKSADGGALVQSLLAALTPSDTLIAAGSFGAEGGFLVFKNEIDGLRLSSISSVKDSTATLIARKLYIARGSFCEKN